MDLVSGEAAMEFWEISSEELAGISFICEVPCVCSNTHKNAYPPHMLGLEMVFKEAYEFAYNLYRLAHCFTENCEILDSSLINIEKLRAAHNVISSKNIDRDSEIQGVKSLLFDKKKLYYAICNSKSFGGPLHFMSAKSYYDVDKSVNNTDVNISKIKDFLYFFSYQHAMMFEELKASLHGSKAYEEIRNEVEYIVKSVVNEKDKDRVSAISGKDLIKRWDGTALDIRKALREGALIPVNKLPGDSACSGPRRTKLMDPCLYCEESPAGSKCERLAEDDYCDGQTSEGQLFRINHEIFLKDEVKRYEEHMGFRDDNGQLRSRQEPKSPCPMTPFEYVELWRSQGVRDHKELASRIDGVFTGDHKLSNRDLGQLLPANPGCEITPRGQTDRGKRLRGLKK